MRPVLTDGVVGELLASAGDDGNVILWVPTDPGSKIVAMGDENFEDKETWRLKHMCRSMGSEIYDLAWSPDGAFFITGSMDNVARVWNTQTGITVTPISCFPH
jgi:chromatin assembly factor 1 subunit B